MNTSVIRPDDIRRKSQVTGHYRGQGIGPASSLISALVSVHFVTAPTRNGQRWRHHPFPPRTMVSVKFMERSSQLFPVFVGLLPLWGYEWTQRPGVLSQQRQTILWHQITVVWPAEVTKAGKRKNLLLVKAVCGEIGGYCYWYCYWTLLFWDGSDSWFDKILKKLFLWCYLHWLYWCFYYENCDCISRYTCLKPGPNQFEQLSEVHVFIFYNIATKIWTMFESQGSLVLPSHESFQPFLFLSRPLWFPILQCWCWHLILI